MKTVRFFSLERAVFVALLAVASLLTQVPARAGLFDDEEARKAILDLRQKVDANRAAAEATAAAAAATAQKQADDLRKVAEDITLLRRSLLDLQSQLDGLRSEMAKQLGQNEQLARDLAELQRRQKDITQAVDDRLRKFEPAKVTFEGREFSADPGETREFESAMAAVRRNDFATAQVGLTELLRRYPQSGYRFAALFWLGNAQYANRDYSGAIANFRALLAQAPEHARAPETALSIANCQIELKDTRTARKTLEDLIKAYPQSEAATAAKDRLSRLK